MRLLCYTFLPKTLAKHLFLMTSVPAWCSDLWQTAGILALGCHVTEVNVNQKDNKASIGTCFWTCILKHSPKIITSQPVNSHSLSGLGNLYLDWTHARDKCAGRPVTCVTLIFDTRLRAVLHFVTKSDLFLLDSYVCVIIMQQVLACSALWLCALLAGLNNTMVSLDCTLV